MIWVRQVKCVSFLLRLHITDCFISKYRFFCNKTKTVVKITVE